MTEQPQQELTARISAATLEGEMEVDEIYVVAWHKSEPAAVAKRDGGCD